MKRRTDEGRINAFETLKQHWRVSWNERKNIEWILSKAEIDFCLLHVMKKKALMLRTHFAERWKLFEERDNTTHDARIVKMRKTKDSLGRQHHQLDRTKWWSLAKTGGCRGVSYMKRPTLAARTVKGKTSQGTQRDVAPSTLIKN